MTLPALPVLLGLRPVILPTGKQRVILDEIMLVPLKIAKPKISAIVSRERAAARYKAAFDAVGGKATAYDLVDYCNVDLSSAKKWLSKNKGTLVRQVGKVPGYGTNHRFVWEWIGLDSEDKEIEI